MIFFPKFFFENDDDVLYCSKNYTVYEKYTDSKTKKNPATKGRAKGDKKESQKDKHNPKPKLGTPSQELKHKQLLENNQVSFENSLFGEFIHFLVGRSLMW